MCSIEKYNGVMGEKIVVERHNTVIDDYVPVFRELEGAVSLVNGIGKCILGILAPVTFETMRYKGKAQLKDGVINIAC